MEMVSISTTAFSSVVDVAISEKTFSTLERFEVLMYSHTSSSTEVNSTQQERFFKSPKYLESNSPTAAALRQYTLRAAYHASIWKQSQVKEPCLVLRILLTGNGKKVNIGNLTGQPFPKQKTAAGNSFPVVAQKFANQPDVHVNWQRCLVLGFVWAARGIAPKTF